MREPESWSDKSLLEDEPFLSAFKARQLAAPPTRRGAGPAGEDDDDARDRAIATTIREMKLFTTVQAWLNLVFIPHYRGINYRQVKADEPGMICLFVKYYWALYHSCDDATGILYAARKEKGFELDDNDTLESTADLTKQVHPNQTSQIGDDASHSLSKEVPDCIPPDIKFQLDAKKDVQGNSSSQTCPPSLDPTSLSGTRQIEVNPSSFTLPLPPDLRNTTAICNLPKKRKGRQITDRRRIKNRKINEATSDTSKLSQNRNDVIDKEAKAGQPPLKIPIRMLPGLKFNKIRSANKDVPDCPEREGGSFSQTCLPFLDPTSLSVTREIEFNPSTLPLPPDSQNTTDLPKPRKRQTSPDTPRKKHRGINEATPDASKLGDASSSTSESTRIELDETANAPVPKFHDFQQGVEAHPAQGKQKSRSNFRATNNTSVLTSPPKDATRQPKQYETTNNPKKRPTSNSEGHQRKRQEVPANQEDSVLQPDLVKKKRGRPPKVKEEQEGSAPLTVQPVPMKKSDRPLKSQVQLNAGIVPFSGQNVDMTQETSTTSFIHYFPSTIDSPAHLSLAISYLQETVEGVSRHDHVPGSMLDRGMKEEINRPENWLWTPEHLFVEDDFILDFEDLAATQMEDRPTNIFLTHKPPLSVDPPIWAQSRQEVCESFDWFRSYQGGVYFAHNAVKGYLLSAFSSKRDRFEHDGKLIISHGGGKSESLHTRKGQTTAQPATDQLAQDKSVRALLDNYRNQRPLALLIDDKYALFPYDLGVKDITYVVLGFYTIAHAWAEFQPTSNGGHVVRYKFAFRWCDNQGSPWWLTEKETNLSDLPPPSIPISFPSSSSSKSPPPAKNMSKIASKLMVPNKSVTARYSSDPTSKRKPRKLLNRGENESENGEGAVLHTTMHVCRICHMDSPHVYTWAWLCLQPDCSGFWKDIKGNFAPDNLEYNLDFLKLMTSLPVPPDFGKLKPDPPPLLSTDGTVTSYAFTRGFHCDFCGRLSCRVKWEKWECSNCKKSVPVFRPPHEAKDFWSNLLPIGYKDHLISKKSKIEQQPVKNFRHENGMGSIQSFILPEGRGKIHHIQPGTPLGRLEADDIFIEYQQQATAGELKFRRWPLRSHKCRGALLTNYFSQNCGEPYQYVGGTANTVPFENAPGAVVKARALIQKRVQQALGELVEFNEILSAAYMERQKMAFHSDNEIGLGPVVAGLSLGSPALMHFRINAKYDRERELKGNLLSFVLRHGDVLVMDGASVQEYYEHTVIPNNFRIAATARHITPGHA